MAILVVLLLASFALRLGIYEHWTFLARIRRYCQKVWIGRSDQAASFRFEEFTLAHADGSYIRLVARFARVDVLVLD